MSGPLDRIVRPAAGTPRATVLLLHGLGQGPDTALAMFGAAIPDDVTTIALRGPVDGPEGQGAGWFSVRFDADGPVPDLAQERASRAALVALAQEAATAGPVVAVGFSQGAMVALHAMLQHPALFRGVGAATMRVIDAVVADLPPHADHVGKPLLWTHGRHDPIMPLAAQEAGAERLADHRLGLERRIHDGGHEVPAGEAAAIRQWLERCLA